MANFTGTPVRQEVSADGSFAVTIPSNAAGVLVHVGGYTTPEIHGNLLDELCWNTPGTQDFTVIGAIGFSGASLDTIGSAFIMTQSDLNWPGAGAHTLHFGAESAGAYITGFTIHVSFITAINAAAALGDTEESDPAGASTAAITTALTGVGVNDLCVIYAVSDTAGVTNVDPAASGQTALVEGPLFNANAVSVGYKVGDGSLETDAHPGGGNHGYLAYVINHGTDSGTAVAPTITDVDTDEIVSQGQTLVPITGTNFEATQGTGTVKIAKTDNIADANVVTQTVTSWAATAIQFTANFPVDVAEGEGCFLFVTNNTGDSNSAGFAITREDLTSPSLTSPTGTATSPTTADGTVSSNEGNGTLYWVVSTNATPPSVAQIQAGNDSTGSAGADSGNQAVSATGVQNVAATGLAASTSYFFYYQQQDAATNDSTVVSSAQFTTNAPVAFTTSVIVNNTGTVLASTAVSWTWLPLGRIGSLNAITALDGTGTTSAGGQLTATGMSAGAGILLVADLVTDATDDLVYYEAGNAA